MSTWEDRMAARSLARRPVTPEFLAGELPSGAPDTARNWCTSCGLPDPPERKNKYDSLIPCPRCGYTWQWYGRLADRDGTANIPPETDLCTTCYEWRRFPYGQEHFGWSWWKTCDDNCKHEHHKDEVWLA